jgi:hypothetical protein
MTDSQAFLANVHRVRYVRVVGNFDSEAASNEQ